MPYKTAKTKIEDEIRHLDDRMRTVWVEMNRLRRRGELGALREEVMRERVAHLKTQQALLIKKLEENKDNTGAMHTSRIWG